MSGGTDAAARRVAARLSAFLHTLRGDGFTVGPREAQDAALLLASPYAARPAPLRAAFRHLLCGDRREWERFDGLFDAFWLGRRARSRIAAAGTSPSASPSLKSLRDSMPGAGAADATDQVEGGDDHGAEGEGDGRGEGRAEGASRAESIAGTDVRKLSDPAQIAEAHAIAARLARVMRARLTRRARARRRGERLDLRRTIRASIAQGGVPLRRVHRRRIDKPLRLVMLLDASGSMSLYTGVFVRFMHGVLDSFHEAVAFLFHTRLAHVSDAMRERDAARALDRLAILAQGAGGGTRIGACLHDFNRWHAARVIHGRTCVMIVSDGYETGDAALLGQEMAALARRCRRIVWLNPMAGWDGYTPAAAGIRAALPHVDLHAPAHTLASLAALEPYLARL